MAKDVNQEKPRRRNLPVLLVEDQDDEVIEETFFTFPKVPFVKSPVHCSSSLPPLVVLAEKGMLRAASQSSLPPPSPFLGPQHR